MSFKDIVALICLLITAWASLATSVADQGLNYGDFHIFSDCTTPASEMAISVLNGSITAPGGASFTDFGFPQSTVVVGAHNVGTVGAATRVCKNSYIKKEDVRLIFTCVDDGQYACTILLTEQ